MDIVLSINSTMLLLERLIKISTNIKEAEFKNILADMYNELADVKLAAATLKEEIVTLKEENARLKHQKSNNNEKPDIKWGCYYFDQDDSRLYCTACYDSKGLKSLTSRINSGFRKCNVCGAVIGS